MPENSYWYITARILTHRRVYTTVLGEKHTPHRLINTSAFYLISSKLPLLSLITAPKLQVAINIAPIVLPRTLPQPSFINSRTAHQVIYDLELAGERLRVRSEVWRS
jgi:hypothetical protein